MPAAHDRERALLRALHAAGHRRVHPLHAAAAREPLGEDARRIGADRRVVDQHLAAPFRAGDAVGAERDLFDRARVEQAEQHDVGCLRRLARRLGLDRAAVERGLQLRPAAVPDVHAEARLQQAERHRLAHQALAEESKRGFVHLVSLFVRPLEVARVRHRAEVAPGRPASRTSPARRRALRAPRLPCRAPARELRVVDERGRCVPRARVDADTVAVLHQRDRPAGRGLRAA